MIEDRGRVIEARVAVLPEATSEPAVHPFPPEQMGRIVRLFEQGRKGANWFYWIAALSVVNSLIIHFGGETHFVMGLGTTLIVDAVAAGVAAQAPQAAFFVKSVAISFDVLVVLMVLGTGRLARRRVMPIYLLGMGLYLLDGLIFLLGPDIMSLAFHGLALFYLWRGFAAYREINALARPSRQRSVVAV